MMRLQRISSSLVTQNKPQKKLIIIFGAPGSGKGTYTKMLTKDFGLCHISTGDQIRNILKNPKSSSLPLQTISQIKQTVSKGGLINDNIVLEIISQKIQSPSCKNGAILDGFPRTHEQLDRYIEKFGIDLVINIKIQQDIIVDKLLGRQTCSNCGKGYNICDINRDGYVMPPMLPQNKDTCDECKGKLVLRDDDTKQTIIKRMQEYRNKSQPLLGRFGGMGVLVHWEPKRGVQDYHSLRDIVERVVEGK